MIRANVDIEDFLDAIGAERDDLAEEIRAKIAKQSEVSFDVRIRQTEIDENASAPDPEFFTLDAQDLRDAMKATLAGDLTIASVLFARVLGDDADAAAAVEQELRKAIAVRRAPATLAVAA